ncbi:MarR family winged helix-turn-helix transcriptional regulator [Halovulum marinum]|uniref:MarR family winged helix-turn-helix transcriptional regulator n=1 Tax=Halovulum marinum TaxID=2662447 RepID=UPI002D766570|nr:MarR family transcriptional regulator [Halovulum marinum]
MTDRPADELLDFAPDVQLFMGVSLLYARLSERIAQVDLGVELSKPEKHLIVRLPAPKRMGDLARELMALPSTVTAVADALEAKGLAVRGRDPDDRRAWLLRLTDDGRALRERMLREAGATVREVTGLSEQDIEQFAALVRQATARILENGYPEGLKLCDT